MEVLLKSGSTILMKTGKILFFLPMFCVDALILNLTMKISPLNLLLLLQL